MPKYYSISQYSPAYGWRELQPMGGYDKENKEEVQSYARMIGYRLKDFSDGQVFTGDLTFDEVLDGKCYRYNEWSVEDDE